MIPITQFELSCQNVDHYINANKIEYPKLILGATPFDVSNIKNRFPDPSFIFLDIVENKTENSICCDLNNYLELLYMGKFFKHTFDKIIFETSVIKFLDWGLKHLEEIKKMLKPHGQFIIPVPNCASSMWEHLDKKPFVVKNQLHIDRTPSMKHLMWNPDINEYIETIKDIYSQIPLKLKVNCFIPSIWNINFINNPAFIQNAQKLAQEYMMMYNYDLLSIVFSNIELIEWQNTLEQFHRFGFQYSHPTWAFVCS